VPGIGDTSSQLTLQQFQQIIGMFIGTSSEHTRE
jgi:hypothetical protein